MKCERFTIRIRQNVLGFSRLDVAPRLHDNGLAVMCCEEAKVWIFEALRVLQSSEG
jgi:hypothetical protein